MKGLIYAMYWSYLNYNKVQYTESIAVYYIVIRLVIFSIMLGILCASICFVTHIWNPIALIIISSLPIVAALCYTGYYFSGKRYRKIIGMHNRYGNRPYRYKPVLLTVLTFSAIFLAALLPWAHNNHIWIF